MRVGQREIIQDTPDFFEAKNKAANRALEAYHKQHKAALNLIQYGGVLPKGVGYRYNTNDWNELKKNQIQTLVQEYHRRVREADAEKNAYRLLQTQVSRHIDQLFSRDPDTIWLQRMVQNMEPLSTEMDKVAHDFLRNILLERLTEDEARLIQSALERKLEWVEYAFNNNKLVSAELRQIFLHPLANVP